MLLLAGFLHGSHLLFGFIEKRAGHDYWIVILSGFLISIPLLLVFTALSKRYPDKDLVQILEAVFGRLLGKIVAGLYVLFFLILLSFNLWDISSFYVGLFMPETPLAVFIVVTALTCAYAVKMGMGSLAKICLLTIGFGIFIPVISSLLLIDKMDFSNLLPVMEMPAQDYIQPLATFITVPFGEAVALLMVLPAVTKKSRLGRYTLGGMAITTLIYIIIGMRNIASLGAAAEVYPQSAVHSLRMIEIGEFLTRIELVIFLVLTTATFVKISVLYYACVKGMSTLLSLKSHNSLILPMGSIAVALASLVFSSSVYHDDWARTYAATFSLPFAVVIPMIALAISLIRKKKEKQSPDTGNPQRETST
jgi:spore germination protein KB